MEIELDLEIPMRDGLALSANVFRPDRGAVVPAIVTVGPYGKDVSFEKFHAAAYAEIEDHGPNVNWETPTPEWWVPRGYAIVRVDQRGTGKSPGTLQLHTAEQATDFYDAIEWVARQPWCTGRIGLLGVSYYAITQWQAAALQPPSLAGIIPWEGASDFYREWSYHGGMRNNVWMIDWWHRTILKNQHAESAPDTLAPGNVDHLEEIEGHPFDDEFYGTRSPDLSQITVPVLSAGNWGGVGLHLRGNIEGWVNVSSEEKWLEVHTGNHTTPFYADESKELQRRFFDYCLRGVDDGQSDAPRVKLAIRRGKGYSWRFENEWPIERTQWTRYYLDAGSLGLSTAVDADRDVTYQAPGGEIRFTTAPFSVETEVTGPLSCSLWLSADAVDADVCVTILNLDANGREVTIDGGRYEQNSVTYGWLRASQRALDEARSLPSRPFHPHQEEQLLEPGELVELEIEIWPTSMVFEAGHRLALVVGAQDYFTCSFPHTDKGRGGWERSRGTNTIHSGRSHPSSLLLPIIPPKGE